jgi:hypothetical protein
MKENINNALIFQAKTNELGRFIFPARYKAASASS